MSLVLQTNVADDVMFDPSWIERVLLQIGENSIINRKLFAHIRFLSFNPGINNIYLESKNNTKYLIQNAHYETVTQPLRHQVFPD